MLFILLLCLVGTALACSPSAGKQVTIGEATYVCVVVNFKSYMVAVPKADDYSRIAIAGCKLILFFFYSHFSAVRRTD